jgi:hypothetical protein
MPTVLQAIAESNTLAHLLGRMTLSSACLNAVLQRIPLSLHTSMAAGPFCDGQWCLLVTNASAVAKLKQLEPLMLETLRAKGFEVQSIRFKRSY